MDYDPQYEVPRRATYYGWFKRNLVKARDEWRLFCVIILLITICILLADLDLSVRWQLASEYEPTLTYPLLKEA